MLQDLRHTAISTVSSGPQAAKEGEGCTGRADTEAFGVYSNIEMHLAQESCNRFTTTEASWP